MTEQERQYSSDNARSFRIESPKWPGSGTVRKEGASSNVHKHHDRTGRIEGSSDSGAISTNSNVLERIIKENADLPGFWKDYYNKYSQPDMKHLAPKSDLDVLQLLYLSARIAIKRELQESEEKDTTSGTLSQRTVELGYQMAYVEGRVDGTVDAELLLQEGRERQVPEWLAERIAQEVLPHRASPASDKQSRD